jgi:hypothetical protein
MNLLPLDWWFSQPIDFEFKQYQLLDYLIKVDGSFAKKILSPHLLRIEKMISDMDDYENKLKQFNFLFEKNKYLFFENDRNDIENDNLNVIIEIIHFSKPQLNSRVELGNIILKNNNQLLF